MKYLKKFNEELETSTYRSAADKLRSKNHLSRASNLYKHSYYMLWNKFKKLFERFGPCKLNFKNNLDYKRESTFYIGISAPNEKAVKESISKAILGESDRLSFYFYLIAVPVDEDSLKFCVENMRDIKKFEDSGYFIALTLKLNYNIVDGGLKFSGIETFQTTHKISLSRRAAVIMKKQLLDCFEQGSGLGSDWSSVFDHWHHPDVYTKIREMFNDADFTLEFGYTMENIYDDIKSYSINDLYTE